ncbi:MAG: mechanosensitive ion channel family protein [Planctomycetota bacterium]
MREWFQALTTLEVFAATVVVALFVRIVLSNVILRLASRTRTRLDDAIAGSVRFPLFLTLLFVGTMIALRRADPPLEDRTLFIVRGIFVTIAALLWMRGLKRATDAVCDALARRVHDFVWIQPRSLPLYEIASGLMVVGAGVYVILLAWQIDLTAWLASAGIIGIAVGFAAKDTLANLFAGIFILADAPYQLGDYIVLDNGDRGKVTEIGIRSTRLLTRDDIEITIPNNVIANSRITNETGGPHKKRRIRLMIGVAYGSDIDQVRAVLMEEAVACEMIAKEPEPRVRFRDMADSALVFHLMGWIDEPALRGRATDALLTAVYKRLTAEGIEIPFPQRDVHVIQEA